MEQFSLSILNDDGTKKSSETLAIEICNHFYLHASDHGETIDPEEFKQNQGTFKALADDILENIDPDESTFVLHMEEATD